MKRIAVVGLGLLFSVGQALWAAETKNIPYYEASSFKSGDLAYLNERCVLDLSIPDGKTNFPTVVWFHGGGLSSGRKAYPEAINRKNVAVAAVNYRLSGPRAACPDYLYDAAAATAWVLNHIAEYGGDVKRVYVSGMSAGGYLSAMLAVTPKYMEAFGHKPTDLAAVFPISGQMTTHFQVLRERRAKNPATPDIFLDEFAPIYNAHKGVPPMALFVGDTTVEWPARNEENHLLEARLRRNFGDKNVRVYDMPTCSHGTVCTPSLVIVNDYLRGATKIW